MRKEVESAVDFLSNVLRCRNMSETQLVAFREHLQNLMISRFENHWFPEKPFKGSGYRCMRIVNNRMDELIKQAGQRTGLSENLLLETLPSELSIWVDPREVSYRIGEEGSIGVIYDADDSQFDQGSMDTIFNASPSPSDEESPSSSASSSPVPQAPYLRHQDFSGLTHYYLPETGSSGVDTLNQLEYLSSQMSTIVAS